MHSSQFLRRRAFTLVEIMIVVLIIGILLAIAVPNFLQARETSRAKSCVANLYQINSAKMQCTMDYALTDASTVTFSIDGTTPTTPGPNGTYQLVSGANDINYIRRMPVCPSGGNYLLGSVGNAPQCSVPADNVAADYQAGGKWFHGY
jgi:prepilin-type N-terminal cleavage/methylation domain-containing protein